ncbi:hypothetical protein KXV85_006041, partial [Aspergillus fumigatus]
HEADSGQIAEPGEIVRPVRVHQRVALGQLFAALVMVDDDDGHPELPGFRQRLDAGGAAIDRYQQRGALACQHAHRFSVGAVALEQAIGDVDQRIEPAMPQVPGEQRRRRRAVDVIVAEDRDLLALHGRIGDAFGGGLHLRHRERVREELADGGIEEVGNG